MTAPHVDCITATIEPAAPFDFGLTAPQQPYFRAAGSAAPDATHAYQRLLDLGEKLVLATIEPAGSVGEPALEVSVQGWDLSAGNVAAATAQLEWVLGTAESPADFYDLAGQDPVMDGIARQFYGMHLSHSPTVFESLVLAVLGQQIAAPVALIVRRLMIETYGPRQTFDGVEHFAFPRPQQLDDAPVEALRGLKLSQRKAEYIKGMAAAALHPSGWLEGLKHLPDGEALERLVELRGVGNWTAHWALTRALGRPDAFPAGDLALRRAVSNLYFGGEKLSAQRVEEFSQRWSPFRAYATAYLFAALRAGLA